MFKTNCLHILKTKCGQKRHVENKHKSSDAENGIVVKEEENGRVPVKQEQEENQNEHNLSNISATCTESRGSRGKKISCFGNIK